MKISIYKYLILLLVCFANSAMGQDVSKLSSFEGRNFYVAFMQNEVVFEGVQAPVNTLDLYISATMDARVEITGPGKVENIQVKSGTMQRVGFQREALLDISEIISDRAIHISSDVPITVYGMNSIDLSSDMFSAVPVMNWGQEYVVMSYPNDTYKGYDDMPDYQASKPRKSQFCVIASENETIITINPKSETYLGRKPDQEFTITLNKGESYLVQSAEQQSGCDLSGTLVYSNKPIGVISGHVRTGIYQNLPFPYASKDHLAEMLAPTNTWGNNYITLPFEFLPQRNATLFRATSMVPNTKITIETASGKSLIYNVLKSRDVIDIDNLNEPAVWKSDAPIQIMQYMRHDGSSNENSDYDPSMCGVPPLEQFVPRILFQVPANAPGIDNQFTYHQALLIIEKNALYNIRIDGNLLYEKSDIRKNSLLNGQYYWVKVPLNIGTHTFVADSGRFSGVLCGNGLANSYAVVLGSSLLPVVLNDIAAPLVKLDSTCGELNGYFYEERDSLKNSGLDFAHVDSLNTLNYRYTMQMATDTSSYFPFTASVINRNREAIIEMYCRDRAGNKVNVSYHYYPLIAAYSHSTLDIGTIDWKQNICKDVWLKNNSKIPYTLLGITSDNPRVKIVSDAIFPLKLLPGVQLNYKICVEPNSDYADINANVKIEYECGNEYTFPVKAEVTATELTAQGFAFGKIYVLNDSCATIVLKNIGETDIIIQSADFIQNSGQFQYNLTDIFPLTIKSGKTFEIPLCFAPTSEGVYSDIIRFNSNSNSEIPVQVVITGTGVQSELDDIDYDFAKHRLGTTTNYEFVLRNLGTADAHIKFHSIETNSSEFDISEFQAIDKIIVPTEEVRFNVKFNPTSIGNKMLKAYYWLDDDINKKYSMTLLGEGTIPTITTMDQFIGEAQIFTSIDKTVSIVKSGGNEALSIESIKLLGGDIGSFIFDLTPYQGIKLNPNEKIDLPVHFAPQFIGYHSVDIEVISDAAPNYAKVKNIFKLIGECHAVDTMAYKFSLKSPESVLACNEYLLEPKIENNGNTPIKVNSLTVEDASIASGVWIEQLTTPIDVMPGESMSFKYKITPKAHESGTIRFNIDLNDYTRKETAEYSFAAITQQVAIEPINNFSFIPGDTVKLKFAGSFPHKSVVPINPKLRIEVNQSAFFLIPNNDTIKIKDNSNYLEIPLVLEQKNNYIDIPLSSNLILEENNALWQIDLEFKAYLANDSITPIRMYFESDKCFDAADDSVLARIEAVCMYDYRKIKLMPNEPLLKTNYNNLTDALDLEIENFTDEKYNFTLYNSFGQIVKLLPPLSLSKGVHLLSIDLSLLSDGLYILNIDAMRMKNNKIFIKNKK